MAMSKERKSIMVLAKLNRAQVRELPIIELDNMSINQLKKHRELLPIEILNMSISQLEKLEELTSLEIFDMSISQLAEYRNMLPFEMLDISISQLLEVCIQEGIFQRYDEICEEVNNENLCTI